MTELRARLRACLAAARQGEEVVVTERGVPIAKITGVDAMSVVDRLTREGVLGPPSVPKRKAKLPTIRPTPGPPISDLVGELRRR